VASTLPLSRFEQGAVLAYDRKEIVTDEAGNRASRWDGCRMTVLDIVEGSQQRLFGGVAEGAEVPLEVADPEGY
jgi:hypothetical protein